VSERVWTQSLEFESGYAHRKRVVIIPTVAGISENGCAINFMFRFPLVFFLEGGERLSNFLIEQKKLE